MPRIKKRNIRGLLIRLSNMSAAVAKTSLEQWAVLAAVIDSGGFAQAALALNRSQSAVSYAVARLQESLGLPFARTGRPRGTRGISPPLDVEGVGRTLHGVPHRPDCAGPGEPLDSLQGPLQGDNNVNRHHSPHRSGSTADRCASRMALQHRLELLPERWIGLGTHRDAAPGGHRASSCVAGFCELARP